MLWEHIRRYMEEDGPSIAEGDALSPSFWGRRRRQYPSSLINAAGGPPLRPGHQVISSNGLSRIMQSGIRNIGCAVCLLAFMAWNAPGMSVPAASSSNVTIDPTIPRALRNGGVVSEFRDGTYGRFFLHYAHGISVVELRHAGRRITVLPIPSGYNPALVGAEKGNRFLPLSLQPYIGQGRLLLIVTRRTTGGDGGGQCGAGVEQYLKVVDVRASLPRIIASHLIESCAEGTELGSQGQDADPLPSLSVVGGRLRVRFLSYKNRLDGPFIGQLSGDFQHVEIE